MLIRRGMIIRHPGSACFIRFWQQIRQGWRLFLLQELVVIRCDEAYGSNCSREDLPLDGVWRKIGPHHLSIGLQGGAIIPDCSAIAYLIPQFFCSWSVFRPSTSNTVRCSA